MPKKLISLVIPVYNEEENIDQCHAELSNICNTFSDTYDVEFVFTDNASTDSTFSLLKNLSAKDSRVRAFRFSRNFGYQKSILTGYMKARGDCAVEYDCDLQDPPEMLPELIRKWEEGYQIVYGVRTSRQEEKIVTFLRQRFYRLINWISEQPLPPDAGDFMLVDRVVLNELQKRRDQHPYLRGIIFSLGFRRIGIPYARRARDRGTSKFPTRRMIALAMDGIISQSAIPLRIASYTGIGVALFTMLMSAFYIFGWLFLGYNLAPGFTTTVLLVLFSIGLNSLFLGIIGEYLWRIYAQLREQSVTIIAETIDNC